MTVAMRPKVREENAYQMRLDAMDNEDKFEVWMDFRCAQCT